MNVSKSNLAIIINSNDTETSSNEISKGNYILNEDKTICENGGKVVSYNNSTGQIGFSFLGSDRCSLYFDKIIDTEKPVIFNLSVNDSINIFMSYSNNKMQNNRFSLFLLYIALQKYM